MVEEGGSNNRRRREIETKKAIYRHIIFDDCLDFCGSSRTAIVRKMDGDGGSGRTEDQSAI